MFSASSLVTLSQIFTFYQPCRIYVELRNLVHMLLSTQNTADKLSIHRLFFLPSSFCAHLHDDAATQNKMDVAIMCIRKFRHSEITIYFCIARRNLCSSDVQAV